MKASEEIYDVIVVGGGAAGMMAAGTAGSLGKKVLLLEKNAKVGEKLAITGGGRCNITNAEEDMKTLLSKYGSAEQFLYSSFARFGVKDTFAFFEGRGLPIIIEANKRAFPKSQRARDVVEVLREFLKLNKVIVRTNAAVEQVVAKDGAIEQVIAGGRAHRARSYIFATGGVSHPETGSTGEGFEWLQTLGHTVAKPTPTIVPLKTKEVWTRDLSGVAVKGVKLNFYSGGKRAFSSTGSVLFTHFGISGPTVLNAAGKVSDLQHAGPVAVSIDLAPERDLGTLDRELLALFEANKNKALKNVIREFYPAGVSEVFLSRVPSLDPDMQVNAVTKEGRRALIDLMKDLRLTITGLMGFDKAVVADGGVPLTEVDMRTMRSLKVSNLFLTGDLLHITRPSGGYSLQLCWTTGYLAGTNAN
jgi:predicted Rossmann fold flavoprotein